MIYDEYLVVRLSDQEFYTLCAGHSVVKAEKDISDEDWKTALVRGTPKIPVGTEILVEGFCRNCYGRYIVTHYNGEHYYIDPRYVSYVRSE